MSLETALARIAQIESSFQTFTTGAAPAAAAGATQSLPSSPATAQTDFATLLQNSSAPSASASALSPTDALAGANTGLPITGGASPLGPATGVSGVAGAPGSTGNGNAIVNIAQSQVGQGEQPPGSNNGPAIATYRTATQGAMAGEPWCAYFVSWAARQAGEPLGSQGQGFGYVGDIWNWAQQTGRAIPNGPGVVPQPGDLILFGDAHVGIVKQVLPNGSIETIEGNYNNQVENVTRGAGEATGYVRM